MSFSPLHNRLMHQAADEVVTNYLIEHKMWEFIEQFNVKYMMRWISQDKSYLDTLASIKEEEEEITVPSDDELISLSSSDEEYEVD